MLEIELFWQLNYVRMLNWIVWNESVFICSTELFEMQLFSTLKLYLHLTKLFEIELFDI